MLLGREVANKQPLGGCMDECLAMSALFVHNVNDCIDADASSKEVPLQSGGPGFDSRFRRGSFFQVWLYQ